MEPLFLHLKIILFWRSTTKTAQDIEYYELIMVSLKCFIFETTITIASNIRVIYIQ